MATEAPPRDGLAIKLALAVRTRGVDVRAVIRTQRTATVRALQSYTRAREALHDDLGALLGGKAGDNSCAAAGGV